MRFLTIVLFAAGSMIAAGGACGGDDAPAADAAQGSGSGSGSGHGSGSGSGSGSGTGSGSGGAFGAACTTASDTSTECASHVCAVFTGVTECSQKCTMLMMTDPSCPTGANGQKCTNTGYCHP